MYLRSYNKNISFCAQINKRKSFIRNNPEFRGRKLKANLSSRSYKIDRRADLTEIFNNARAAKCKSTQEIAKTISRFCKVPKRIRGGCAKGISQDNSYIKKKICVNVFQEFIS